MDKLKKAFKEIKSNISENYIANTKAYNVVEKHDVTDFDYDYTQTVQHKVYETNRHDNFDTTRDELIALVKELVAGAHSVFWRGDPTIISQKDFCTGKTYFYGVVRLSVLKKDALIKKETE